MTTEANGPAPTRTIELPIDVFCRRNREAGLYAPSERAIDAAVRESPFADTEYHWNYARGFDAGLAARDD